MAAKIVAIANMAGSAGKTTTAVSLATLLAESGQQVLVCDFDAQANATTWFGLDSDSVVASSAKVLLRECQLADAIVDTEVENVRLLPASRATMDNDVLSLHQAVGYQARFRAALRTGLPEDVDVVIVDCPGTFNSMTFNALMVATGVVTVTRLGAKEMSGIAVLEDALADVAELADREAAAIAAIVPTQVLPPSRGRLYVEAHQLLRQTYEDAVTPGVRDSVRVAEAYSHGVPLPIFAPAEPVTEDYRQVLKHLQARGIV